MNKLHVASIDYRDVFLSVFGSIEECKDFYEKIEQVDITKYMFHQTARMVWLGDQVESKLAKGRPALQILFYLIAAEAVAKTAAGFKEEGQSKVYVRKFFESYCEKEDLQKIEDSIESRKTSNKTGIDFLYDIRCDVVHEGRYFDTLFPQNENEIPSSAYIGNDFVIINMTINEIKLIILRAAKNACTKVLKTEVSST